MHQAAVLMTPHFGVGIGSIATYSFRSPESILATRVGSDTVDKRSINNRASKSIIDYLSMIIDNSGSRR